MLLRKGDIVRVVKTGYKSVSCINDKAYMCRATVLEDQRIPSCWVCIELDLPNPMPTFFHSCNDLCEDGKGWYCDAESLELVIDVAPVNEDISIGTDSLMEVLYGV